VLFPGGALANVAIVIGNTDYQTLSRLQCCGEDVLAMKELLEATGRFENIELILNSDSSQLKERLRTVVDGHKAIGEIFFYFTGHGFQSEAEFFFCATDFNAKRPNETGLSNSELHVLLRTPEADLVVKVIDACNSGALLIKSDGSFLPVNKQGFKNLIQISSCLDSQNSLSGNPLSVFTENFRAASLRKTEGIVYYTDIIDALRDDFLDNNAQTPHFVSQGTGREQFVESAKRLDGIRAKVLAPSRNAENNSNISSVIEPVLSQLDILVRAESRFAKKDLAQEFIGRFFDKLSDEVSPEGFLGQLFTPETVIHSTFQEPTTREFLIRVLSGEKRPDTFVTAEIPRAKRRTDPLGLSSLAATMSILGGEDPLKDYELRLNCQLDKVQMKIVFSPKFVCLKRFVLVVTCAPSLERCYVMEMLTEHSLIDWGVFDSEGAQVVRRWYKMSWTDTCGTLVTMISQALKDAVNERIDATLKALSG
jgi:Caspase domain